MGRPPGRALCAALAMVLALAAAAAGADAPVPRDPGTRLHALEREIARLTAERDELKTRETGLLGELGRLDADLRLAAAQQDAAALRLTGARGALAAHVSRLAELEEAQRSRARYLAARIREIYKTGALGVLEQVLAPATWSASIEGVRYATYLARRDAEQIAAWRETARRVSEERAARVAEAERFATLEEAAGRSRRAIGATRAARAGVLTRIRNDREQHDRALSELDAAARDLSRIVEAIGGAGGAIALDMRSFRGLLDWPASGPVSSGFGQSIHPVFKTVVPHPGLDIDAPEGAPIRSVFEGRVAYAAPLHGYGLTVIVDHGHGLLSISAHAEVLLVSAGDSVERGQELGRVGESGSLRGPFLYFELRDGGRPVDPAAWLRRR